MRCLELARCIKALIEDGPTKFPTDFKTIKWKIVGDYTTYVSFGIDYLDTAFAPESGIPMVGEMTSFEALQVLHGLKG